MLKYYSKPRKKAAHPEAALQKRIVQFLLMNDAFYFSIPNESKRSVVMGAHMKQMGLIPGAADLGIVVDGKIHFLEVKDAKGEQSASQREFQKRCQANKIPYAICFSLTEALAYLQHWKAIKPVKVAA
jgi:hypothetical protein